MSKLLLSHKWEFLKLVHSPHLYLIHITVLPYSVVKSLWNRNPEEISNLIILLGIGGGGWIKKKILPIYSSQKQYNLEFCL